MSIRIQIAGLPDRENLVADLWLGDVQLAEVSKQRGRFEVEDYADRVSLPLDPYPDALARTKDELMT